MQKFRFRLATLLKMRHMEEEQAQLRLAEAMQQSFNEQEKLRRLTGKFADNINALQSSQLACPTIAQLKIAYNYLDKLKEEIARQKKQVNYAEQCCRQRQKDLEQAVQARKVVEKLHEKRRREYLSKLGREEQKLLDEMGALFVARKQ
ncbi:flagellar export protein FliJ [Sporolituus thermophilus]|uniref:Flagellar FliJ protein n=1 Tax=Sporolituus thermophilus DSM 23256 TaxID=1123285 RepID=A0A1G7KP84_9FIRM|nr:flagellar export protein FliJ [Sporolituus thermophilus]SDF38941.1 FliJ protein [Sporolituus thermophilus DSM 23256]